MVGALLFVDGFARCMGCGAGREVSEPGTARVRRSSEPCVDCGGVVFVTSSAPARCESCGARAEVVLDDGSTWCDGCHSVAWRSDHVSGCHVDELVTGAAERIGGDELVEDGDPYECAGCVAEGEPCRFHHAWAAGWDACAAFMAAVVNERAGEQERAR